MVGRSLHLHVRQESVDIGLGGSGPRLLYASDLHLGRAWTRNVPALLLEAVAETEPDALLLGGDLADGPRGVRALGEAIAGLARTVTVAAVPGNHDALAGVRAVRDAVVGAGGRWLPDAPLDLDGVVIEGRVRRDAHVLCAHYPQVWPEARKSGVRLTLAGHLHGCQWVAYTARGRMYPGAWFYRWNGLRFEEGDSTLVVSRGAGDTLPVRWNCPREVVLAETC